MNVLPWLVAAALTLPSSAGDATGDAAFARGDFDAALNAYSAAVAAAPNDVDALIGLGTADLYRGDLTDARTYLAKALHVKPNDARATSRMAALQKIAGAPGDFVVSLERPAVDVPFVVTDPLPMVRAKVNGSDAVLLIDTGAPSLELSADAARRLRVRMQPAGVGVFAGGQTARILAGRVDLLAFPGASVRGIPAGQLPAEMPANLDGHPFDGIIGTALLRQFLSTLDYRNGRLILRPRSASNEFEAASRAANATIVPMWLVPDHFIFARATVNGTFDGLFSVDTGGAGVGITLTAAALAAAKIVPDASKASSGIGGGGPVRVVPFDAATVSLGSFTRRDVPGLYTPAGDPYGRFPFTVAGAISHDFFRTSALTFDFSAMKLVVQ